MPRTLAGWIFAIGLLLVVGVGVWLGRHYNDAYSIRLHAPNDSWLHDLPWQYEDLHGDAADDIVDSVFFGRGEAEVVALTAMAPLLTSNDREPFERGFGQAFQEKSGGRPGRCAAVTTDEDTWNCMEWTVDFDQVPIRLRAYHSGRGITKAVILFAAPAERFSVFGDPRRWLGDLEWQGPSLAHAIGATTALLE